MNTVGGRDAEETHVQGLPADHHQGGSVGEGDSDPTLDGNGDTGKGTTGEDAAPQIAVVSGVPEVSRSNVDFEMGVSPW